VLELNCESKYMTSKIFNNYLLKRKLGEKFSRIQTEKHTKEEFVLIRKIKVKENNVMV
jgi:hypothetical protein